MANIESIRTAVGNHTFIENEKCALVTDANTLHFTPVMYYPSAQTIIDGVAANLIFPIVEFKEALKEN